MTEKYLLDAAEMIGSGYEPSVEIESPRIISERRDGKLVDVERTAFIKLYTSFKRELKEMEGNDLKVWVYLALSVNRYSKTANPGLRKIAEETGLAVNTVRSCVERLEEKGLLGTEKEAGKGTNYRPADYVSVSKNDTVTVSKFDTTVSKKEPTVSTPRGKIAQLEELELTRVNSLSADDFKAMSVEQARKVPELKLYAKATNFFPGSLTWHYVYTFIRENGLTEDRIRTAAEQWELTGYQKTNVKGILEWSRDGVPQTHPRLPRRPASPKGKAAAALELLRG